MSRFKSILAWGLRGFLSLWGVGREEKQATTITVHLMNETERLYTKVKIAVGSTMVFPRNWSLDLRTEDILKAIAQYIEPEKLAFASEKA